MTDSPTFLQVIPGKRIVKIPALVVQPVVVSNAFMIQPLGSVEFIADQDPGNSTFSYQRQHSKYKYCYCPESYRVLIRTYAGKVLANKGHVPQHPGKYPVRIGPYSPGVGNILFKVIIGIHCGKPVPAGFIDKNGMGVAAHFIHQPISEEAVFTSAG